MIDLVRKGRLSLTYLGIAALLIVMSAVIACLPRLISWYDLLCKFEALSINEFGLREYRHCKTGMIMVRLQGAVFWMGAQNNNPKGLNYDPEAMGEEAPVHKVTLTEFLIGKFEVTRQQWETAMGIDAMYPLPQKDGEPVCYVSWNDIQEFELETGLNLPTEAQWEYACRGGTNTPYGGIIDHVAWTSANSGKKAHAVGTKASNNFGLHDMHGNLYELCEDLYDPLFYEKQESCYKDPVSTYSMEDSRSLRGGCMRSNNSDCRSSMRLRRTDPGGKCDFIGFRVIYIIK